MQEKFIVAIDGPAGAGKSTIAKIIAQKLGYIYIDTGAMYRAVAWKALQLYKEPTKQQVEQIAQDVSIQFINKADGVNSVVVNGNDVTDNIREPNVTAAASKFSAYPVVRSVMSEKQRAMGIHGGVVMDGRDIGTCIFPQARYKFFLTANVRVRARRRYSDMLQKGYKGTLEEIESDMIARDHADSSREIAPLEIAPDAILVDSSELGIEETVNRIYKILQGECNVL